MNNQNTAVWFQKRLLIMLIKWLKGSTLPTDGSLTDPTTLGKSGPGSNVHEGVLHIPQSCETGATLSDAV